MAIYITGDIHARPEQTLSSKVFPQGKTLTKNDYVIICGDFGLVWNKDGENEHEKHWLDWLEEKPWTTLFIDGNHENFDRLNDYKVYPCEEWNGGMVQRIRPSVMHLCRGEIFNIEGLSFLALGGNYSHDIQHGIIDPADYVDREDMKRACRELERKHGGWQYAMYRIKGESWWEQEVPSKLERGNAINNLSLVDNKVDIILTHGLPATDLTLLFKWNIPNEYEVWLEDEIRSKIDYKYLFSGHYHMDKAVSYKDICVYQDIIQIA